MDVTAVSGTGGTRPNGRRRFLAWLTVLLPAWAARRVGSLRARSSLPAGPREASFYRRLP
jgi:hypothetical protein